MRQGLHRIAVGLLAANRDNIDYIREEVAVRVGQGDANFAAGGFVVVRGRRVVVVVARRQDDAAAVAAGGEGEDDGGEQRSL